MKEFAFQIPRYSNVDIHDDLFISYIPIPGVTIKCSQGKVINVARKYQYVSLLNDKQQFEDWTLSFFTPANFYIKEENEILLKAGEWLKANKNKYPNSD